MRHDDDSVSDMALAVLEEQADATIRRAEIHGVWYFSVIDVIAILTESSNPRNYWNMLKTRLAEEGSSQTYTNCVQLRLLAADGKARLTDTADLETAPHSPVRTHLPRLNPVKRWLAKVGAQHLEAREQVTVPSPTTPIAQAWMTDRPADGDLLGWAEFLERVALVYRQQARLEARVSYLETASRGHESRLDALELRLDAVEQSQKQLPELLDLLKPEQLSPLHQTMLQRWVNDLAHLTGWHISMIYQDLVADFNYHTFTDAKESDWQRIADWFQARLDAARKRR